MREQRDSFKLIKAGRLIDGRGGPPIENGAVLVQGSRIRAVGMAKDVAAPEGARVDLVAEATGHSSWRARWDISVKAVGK